jgi:hypothetical protein
MVFFPVIVVVMLESQVARCVHCDEDVACITTTITGQKTIGSETQPDLLTMGVKTLKTC